MNKQPTRKPIAAIATKRVDLVRAAQINAIDLLREAGIRAFATGSAAFGAQTEKSDADIAILVGTKEAATNVLTRQPGGTESEMMDSDYNQGRKLLAWGTGRVDINLVPLHPLDFVCWYLTTQHLAKLCEVSQETRQRLHERTRKLGTFEMLTGLHKTLIPYEGHEEAMMLYDRLVALNGGDKK